MAELLCNDSVGACELEVDNAPDAKGKREQRTPATTDADQPKRKQPRTDVVSQLSGGGEQPAVAGTPRSTAPAEQSTASASRRSNTPRKQPAVVGHRGSEATAEQTSGVNRSVSNAASGIPAVAGSLRLWRGDVSIMAFLVKEGTAWTMALPWNAIGIVFGGVGSADVRIKDGFERSIGPTAIHVFCAVVLEAWRPQVVYEKSLVTSVDWSRRVAWMSTGEYDEFEDEDEGSKIINGYCVAKFAFHERIKCITDGRLGVGIAAMSEPWGEDVARDAMELLIHEKSHIVLVGWLRSMMSHGRGKSSVLELQKAFLMDGRYRLEDVTGELNFDSVGVFRLVPLAGVGWPQGVEFKPKVKQWRADVASIWIRGPVANTRSDEAVVRRRGRHSNPRSRVATESSGTGRARSARSPQSRTRGRGQRDSPGTASEPHYRRSWRDAAGSSSSA